MAIQTFTAAQVLTAAQMNALQANDYNQTVSAKVASYTLVAADKGTRITMSNASATTITVNTSLFAAGDSLRIQNIGAGACTITAGTATVTSAGPLALIQWAGGQLFFTSASAAIWFPDAVTTTAGGLVFIGSSSPSAVTSASFNSCFSATYQNYRILINYTASVGANAMTTMRLRASGTDSTTGYKSILMGWGAGAATSSADVSGTDDWYVTYLDPTGNSNIVAIDVFNPFGAAPTTTISTAGYASSIPNYYAQVIYSANTASTSYDGFTIFTSGTSFTGTIRVYGYANS